MNAPPGSAGQGSLISPISRAAARAVAGNTPFRQARTCYGHLAGVAGVALMGALEQHGWLVAGARGPVAAGPLAARIAPGQAQGRTCLDWTERRPHLGGALGRAVTAVLLADGVLLAGDAARQVTLVGSLAAWLQRLAVSEQA